MANFEEFCNPKSAITVGASSAMVIAFTTTLYQSFGLPQAMTALALSGVFALTQILASHIKEKSLYPVYFVIVTLIIFSAARGGNKTVSNIEDLMNNPSIETSVSFIDLFIPSVSAQITTNQKPSTNTVHSITNKIEQQIIVNTPLVSKESDKKNQKIFNAW